MRMPVGPVVSGQGLADALHQGDPRLVGARPVDLAAAVDEAALGPGKQEGARRIEVIDFRKIDDEALRRRAGQAGEKIAELPVEEIRLVDDPFAEGAKEQPIPVESVVERCFHERACSRLTSGPVRVSRTIRKSVPSPRRAD